MLYDPEDDMKLYIPSNVVPCRGRESREDTSAHSAVDPHQLDQVAPLEPGDAKEMGEQSCPSSETIERMKQRILAAGRLKYGR